MSSTCNTLRLVDAQRHHNLQAAITPTPPEPPFFSLSYQKYHHLS